MTDTTAVICINCGQSEDRVPLTWWQFAGQRFWICPDCLPFLIHRRSEVMPRWNLREVPQQE